MDEWMWEQMEEHRLTNLFPQRDKLWDIYPHVSVGHFRFLSLQFASDPCYKDALRRLLAAPAAAFLDVGCGVGQALRQLASDGVDSRRLYGVDLEPGFIRAGYELFRDRDRLKATFLTGDVLLKSSSNGGGGGGGDGDGDGNHGDALEALDGRMSIIHATSFFHLFGWEAQVRAAVRMVRFLRPDDRDAMIFGRHVGTSDPGGGGGGGVSSGSSSSSSRYLHNAETWQRLWDEAGARTGTRWRTEVEFLDRADINMGGPDGSVRRLRFGVFRA